MTDNVIPFPGADRDVADTRTPAEQEVLDAIADGLDSLEDDFLTEADKVVIDDEEAFIRRFRFDAPRNHRRKLILMKHRADLTDREIRLLQRAGALRFNGQGAEISAPVWLTFWGWVQTVSLFALMLFGFAAASRVADPSVLQIIQLTAIEFAILAAIWAVLHMHITPRRILKRVSGTIASRS